MHWTTTYWASTVPLSSTTVSDHLQSATKLYCDVFGTIVIDYFYYYDIDFFQTMAINCQNEL